MLKGRIFERISSFTLAEQAKQLGYYFYFREITSDLDTEVTLKGNHKVLMLGSNSYMGLTNHPEVKEAALKALTKYGTGNAGSRFLNGTLDIHCELEAELADWLGKEAVILFSTGFQVNQGVIATLLKRQDYILMDISDHASIFDGARLSMAKPIRYPHNDMDKLGAILATLEADKVKFIIADGVFSMEGDITRLPELVALADRYGATLMIDDAHGLGVLGPKGRGTVAHFGLTDRVDFIMGTFSKSLAAIGGFVAANKLSIEYLKHHSRAFIFSASLPASAAASALAALKIIKREPERIARLWHNTREMLEGLKALGYNTGCSETPIIPVYVGDEVTLMKMCKRLEEEGIFAVSLLPPAVQPNQCLVRVSLMATHTSAQITFALEKFEKIGKELGVI